MKYLFLALVIVASLFEAFGDILLKQWSLLHSKLYFVMGIVVYVIAIVFWAVALKYETLSRAIVVATLINVVVVLLFGVLILRENISSVNKLGILLGFVAIVLLEI